MPSVYSTLFLASLPFTLAFSAERRQALPADFSSLPSCGQNCLITAATSGSSGCPLTDFKCLANSGTFKDSVTKCALSSCSPSDQIAMANWAVKTSASLGISLDLSQAAAAAGVNIGNKQTPAPEKPSSDDTTEAKPAPAKKAPTTDKPKDDKPKDDKPKDQPTSDSSNQPSPDPVAPTANDGYTATSKDTQSSVTAAPAGSATQASTNATISTSSYPTAAVGSNPTASSTTNNATDTGNTPSASNQTESQTSGSSLSVTVDILSLTLVTVFVSSFL
ncbi:uncharacterized protein MELLADRAFT_72734 [Melampsora larici-populina 98AG31]|uniref:CFEM domain-containing protein n=1 Tax=Melampsora larici-populina (strain 98AG31 / pathotype 3-4-7) TaxID=747676 RepID=F4RY51_MELLP|nr:uncharacterized protein MELLADRAFT_72734 [Melampsora larici-populina 98AG31]EGG02620.1 hypothetical protein MELLADRAFT_72734 [Melampsora larici-populina 98AG31]